MCKKKQVSVNSTGTILMRAFHNTRSDFHIEKIALAPVLANIFMGFYESKWENKYYLNKPIFLKIR